MDPLLHFFNEIGSTCQWHPHKLLPNVLRFKIRGPIFTLFFFLVMDALSSLIAKLKQMTGRGEEGIQVLYPVSVNDSHLLCEDNVD